jgi:MYXO-CTERM domain-containing protein
MIPVAPAGGAPARRWWRPAPGADPGPVISARRAYAEALGVYLAFFAPSIVVAAGTLASFSPPDVQGWWVTGSNGVEEVTQAALAVTVVVLLAARRRRRPADVGLALARARGGPGARQAIRMAAWAAVAFLAGGIVTSVLASAGFPFGHASVANTVLELTAAGNAGIMEEVVVLGFLVTTLEQARRPRAEIAAVALVCRGAYHIYYGPGAVGILVWASVFLWLFWRFRSVVPMIITHICWDTMAFLTRLSAAVGGLLLLLILGLVVTAIVLWLVDRSGPDPAGPRWDGRSPPWGAPAWATTGPWGAPAPPAGPSPARPDQPPGWGPPAA